MKTLGTLYKGSTAIGTLIKGSIPSGTINITENGTYDVTNYASANVTVGLEEDVFVTLPSDFVEYQNGGRCKIYCDVETEHFTDEITEVGDAS